MMKRRYVWVLVACLAPYLTVGARAQCPVELAGTELALSLGIEDSAHGYKDTIRTPFKGVTWTHRRSEEQNIHIATIDLTHPSVKIGAGLAGGSVSGRGTTSGIAKAKNAQVALNADFTNLVGTYAGAPQNIHVEDGVLKANPRYRTAVGFTPDKQPRMGFWVHDNPPAWTWGGVLRTEAGAARQVVHMNKDVNPGWVCVYTYDFNADGKSMGNEEFSDGTEVITDASGTVVAIRSNQLSYPVPVDGYVYIGRGEGAEWLQNYIQEGQAVELVPDSHPPWQDYETVVGGGPAIVKNGAFHADPQQEFPHGEDLTIVYKRAYYESRHPRSLIGLSEDGQTLFLVTVDGRASDAGRAGMTLAEAAELMIELGAYEVVSMDGGGSSTMYIEGEGVVNYPSDGTERAISNALLVFSKPTEPAK